MVKDTLEHSDVVFMYSESDLSVYTAYGATVLGWGAANTLEKVRDLKRMGIHPTGSMWCLTAGAEALHKDADLREATARDIEGNPVAVPWLWDHVYEGTSTLFGCTNHPTFRAHVRKKVCEAMAGGAMGLQVDDHRGTASALIVGGGGFCDYCMAAFRRYLQEKSSPELLAEAGVKTFEGFDYRDLVRKYASTREEFMQVAKRIPLYWEFVDCQLQLAAENTRGLKQLAEDIVGHPVTLSANACFGRSENAVVRPYLTYLVCEVSQGAVEGVNELLSTVRSYRMGEAVRRPMAATAGGGDWAYAKEHEAESLVRIWIALAYACGQRFMAPSTHQWCFTKEKGTHWYKAPTEAYAPLYRFVREHRELFDDLETVGPLVVPPDVPSSFETYAKRQALDAALDRGDPRPLTAGDTVWVFPREGKKGIAVAHLVNANYEFASDVVTPCRDLVVTLPKATYERDYTRAELYSYDGEAVGLTITESSSEICLTVPELRQWAIIELRP